jgi:hypothetical protein
MQSAISKFAVLLGVAFVMFSPLWLGCPTLVGTTERSARV